jgi:hypothetical protein
VNKEDYTPLSLKWSSGSNSVLNYISCGSSNASMTTAEMEQSYTLLKLSMLGINTLKIGRYNRAEPPNYIAEMELWCLVIDVFVAFWSFAYDFISSALRQTLQNTPYFLFLRLSTFFPKNNPSLSSYLREYQPHMNY